MNTNNEFNLQYFVVVAKKNKKNKLLALLGANGACVLETVYVHGSLGPSIVKTAFGLDNNQSKVMISCLLKDSDAKNVVDIINKKYKFYKPNTGIAFSVLLEGLIF